MTEIVHGGTGSNDGGGEGETVVERNVGGIGGVGEIEDFSVTHDAFGGYVDEVLVTAFFGGVFLTVPVFVFFHGGVGGGGGKDVFGGGCLAGEAVVLMMVVIWCTCGCRCGCGFRGRPDGAENGALAFWLG